MQTQEATALVYGDGVIDICQNENIIDTLRPELGDSPRETLARHGWEGTLSGQRDQTAEGPADVWDIEPAPGGGRGQTHDASTITAYARVHGIEPGDMVVLIHNDPDPVAPVGVDPQGRTIDLPDGTYLDALYPVAYLSLVAEGVAGAAGTARHADAR